MNGRRPFDLVVLVADKDAQEGIDEILLSRRASLGMREISYRFVKHPRKDPGVYNEAHGVLQPFVNTAEHALAIFDHEGSGQDDRNADEVGEDLQMRLNSSGWGSRAAVIVIRPELETWVWSDSPNVDEALGWAGRSPSLREWMRDRGFLRENRAKPDRPKECFDAAIRAVQTRHSSAIFRRLAGSVGLERCDDESFIRFKQILLGWFPAR